MIVFGVIVSRNSYISNKFHATTEVLLLPIKTLGGLGNVGEGLKKPLALSVPQFSIFHFPFSIFLVFLRAKVWWLENYVYFCCALQNGIKRFQC